MNQVVYSIGVAAPITPSEPLPPLPEIPRGSLVIVEGRAPIWRYGMALHLLHGSPAAAVAFYDPRLGAVVVATHSREWQVGEVLDVTLPEREIGEQDRRAGDFGLNRAARGRLRNIEEFIKSGEGPR